MGSEGARKVELQVPTRALGRRLLRWYERARRDLPWRNQADAYRIWVAETMLQQTRIQIVLPYYRCFLESFPRVEDLALAPRERVLSLWSGLGYYRRADNLWRAAQIINREHRGRFPRDRETALKLPGVGAYTAGAVLSQAYGLPEAILDGNVKRVLARLLCVAKVDASWEKAFWSLLSELVKDPCIASHVRDFNQALMELGALVCTPRHPSCEECPLESFCEARQAGMQEEVPYSRKKRPPERLLFISAVILDSRNCVLLTRASSEPYLQGFWEFPKIKAGAENIPRRFRTEHSLSLRPIRRLKEVKHQVTFRKLVFIPLLCELLEPVSEHPEWRWTDLERESLPASSYIHKIWRAVTGSV